LLDGGMRIWDSPAIVEHVAEVSREAIWPTEDDVGAARYGMNAARNGTAGEFLFGEFTAADAMFAPVSSRFQT
jgi:glutathione S-transferase